MDPYITHPSNAEQAKQFTAPSSLSFPNAAGHLTPPSSDKDGQSQPPAGKNGQAHGGNIASQQSGNGVTPATPAATPGAGQGVSGIVPTLQ